jgi:hypothetical protein
MARNRVIYQSEALYVSSGAAALGEGNHKQLERVQSANFNYTINRQDINQFGELARIDSLILDPPTVSTDFSYYLTDGFNERCLGFYVQTGSGGAGGVHTDPGGFASGHLTPDSGKNIFIVTASEGTDINLDGAIGATDTVIGIGNCYLSNYSVDMAVGSIPTVSVSMEGANVRSDTDGAAIDTPAVDQSAGTAMAGTVSLPDPTTGVSNIAALRPGDITVNIANFADESVADINGDGSAHVQSVSISVPLSRSPISRLGSRFPFAREVDFPVTVSMSISSIMNETAAYQLVDKLDAASNSATVTLKDKDGKQTVIWTLSGAKVDSESISSSIGSNKTVDLTLSTQIGGPSDLKNGLYMSGANGTAAFSS